MYFFSYNLKRKKRHVLMLLVLFQLGHLKPQPKPDIISPLLTWRISNPFIKTRIYEEELRVEKSISYVYRFLNLRTGKNVKTTAQFQFYAILVKL